MRNASSKVHTIEDATAAALYVIGNALLFGSHRLPPDVQRRPGVQLVRDDAENMLTAHARSKGSIEPEEAMQMVRTALDHCAECDLDISELIGGYDGE